MHHDKALSSKTSDENPGFKDFALTRLRQKGKPCAMMLMLNIFITVWCGRGSLALLRSTGTKPWLTAVFPGLDILSFFLCQVYYHWKNIAKNFPLKLHDFLFFFFFSLSFRLVNQLPTACCLCLSTFSCQVS